MFEPNEKLQVRSLPTRCDWLFHPRICLTQRLPIVWVQFRHVVKFAARFRGKGTQHEQGWGWIHVMEIGHCQDSSDIA